MVEGRLITVTNGTTVTVFTYDGDGKRVKQTVAPTTTVFIGNYCEIAISGTQRITTTYYYANGQRIAMRTAAGVTYIHSDHLGSSAVTSGAQSGNIKYFPYGATRSGAVSTAYKFTGQRLDDSTGLYYYGARYYDAAMGRFIQADTIVPDPADPQALNRYSYVYNNPLRYIDPSGYDPLDAAWEEEFCKQHGGRSPTDQDRYLRLLSLLFNGSGPNGMWTTEDWQSFTYQYQSAMASENREFHAPGGDPGNGLQLFADHLRTLSKYYKADETKQFVRAVAFLWSGIPYDYDFEWGVAGVAIRNVWRLTPLQDLIEVHLTPYPMLWEGASGWNPAFVDDPNPSHHYAVFMASGYVMGYSLSVRVNEARDPDSLPDIRLGNTAAAHGSRLKFWRIFQAPGRFAQIPDWVLRDFR